MSSANGMLQPRLVENLGRKVPRSKGQQKGRYVQAVEVGSGRDGTLKLRNAGAVLVSTTILRLPCWVHGLAKNFASRWDLSPAAGDSLRAQSH